MKKTLAILLSVLMVISCFSITATAVTETLVADTLSFSNELNEYIISLGLGESYFDVDTTADGYVADDPSTYTYTNLFTPENVRTSDKVKIYKETKNEIIFQIVGPIEEYTTQKIGEFCFTSDTFFHESNPCGYFYGYATGFRSIEYAEDYWINGLEYVASVLPCINEKPEDVQKAEALIEAKYGYSETFALNKVGTIGDYTFYYKREYLVEGMSTYVYMGNYVFVVQGYNTNTRMYVVKDNDAYLLEDAYDAGFFTDMDAFYEKLTNNGRGPLFTMEKMETAMYLLTQYYRDNGIDLGDNYLDCDTLGTVGKYTVVYGGDWNGYVKETSAYGDYIFNVSRSFALNNQGFWIADDESIYPLIKAYTEEIISETEFHEICEQITADTKYSSIVEKSATDAETVFKAKFGEGNYSLAQIADFDEYGVYYNVPAGVTFLSYTKQIGDYEFDVFSQQTPYDIGLYVITDTEVYTLEEAWNEKIITPENMLDMYKAIKESSLQFSFSVKRFQFTDGTGTVQPTDPIPTEPAAPTLEISKDTIEAGEKIQLTVNNAEDKAVTFKSLKEKVATIDKNGVVTGLKKGKAELAVKVGEETLTCTVKVKNNPKLINVKNGKKADIVKVKQNKTVKVKIQGKAKNIENIYKSTNIAKIKSKPNASVIKVKGLKKGATILKIRVNGVKTLKLVVVVK